METLTFLKVKYALYSTLVYYIISNPETFKLTQLILGNYITLVINDIPTPYGIFLHTGLFFLSILGLMLLPRDSQN